MVTYEEYEKRVIEELEECLGLSKKEATAYVKTDDSQDVIRDNYSSCRKKLKEGVITKSVFLGDGVNSSVHCLCMLY